MISVSVIITARNYGKYLPEAIESCIRQTVKPLEIIYSDDFSDDSSINVACKYPEVIVVPHDKHLGVVAARNDGASYATSDAIIFLDGDDILTNDYIERHLQVFDRSTPFVYGPCNAFGDFETWWPVKSWGTSFLWNRNFVNTSALIWRDAFYKVGCWQETCVNTMWDWSLALRLSRLGRPRKSSAVLNYRQHSGSWSLGREKSEGQLLSLSERIRRDMVNMTIGLIYSGRIPGFINKWMEILVKDLGVVAQKPQLIIINNSDENLGEVVEKYGYHFSEIKIITGKKIHWKDERDRRNEVCELLSDQYNRILENANGELVHLREDDIIPNENSFRSIYEYITNGNPVKEAVAGIYLNRNPDWQKIVGGFYNDENPRSTVDLENVPTLDPFVIDYTGTGFLIFWKDLCPTFKPYCDGIQAHDWAWGKALKQSGGRLWMIPSAVCRHYSTDKEYLEYNPKIDINPTNTFTRTVIEKNFSNKSCRIVKRSLNLAN
jgi:glycosyltransferase involved in cell wall biosynthesis